MFKPKNLYKSLSNSSDSFDETHIGDPAEYSDWEDYSPEPSDSDPYLQGDPELKKNCDNLQRIFSLHCSKNDWVNAKQMLVENKKLNDESGYYLYSFGLSRACADGDISLVKYLLTTTQFSDLINIHDNNDEALTVSMEKKRFDVVKFLLCSPALSEHVDINDSEILKEALKGYLEPSLLFGEESSKHDKKYQDFIKFLLVQPNLKENVKVDAINDREILSSLILRGDTNKTNFFICELNLQGGAEFFNQIKTAYGQQRAGDFHELFNKRDLLFKLNENLPEKPAVKKIKI